MTQTFPRDRTFKTLSQLQTQFNLQHSTDEQFFTEWLNLEDELTDFRIDYKWGKFYLCQTTNSRISSI